MHDAPAEAGFAGPPQRSASLVAGLAHLAATQPHEPAYTFVDYTVTLAGNARILTWAALDRHARAVAAALRGRVQAGERAAVLAPQGLGYVVAMLGAFYARVTAVPLFTPDLPGHRDRLDRIIADADPACVLTTADATAAVAAFLRERRSPSLRDILAIDAAGQARPRLRWHEPAGAWGGRADGERAGGGLAHGAGRERRPGAGGGLGSGAGGDRRRRGRLPAIHVRIHPPADRRDDHSWLPCRERRADPRGAAGRAGHGDGARLAAAVP